MTRFYGMAPEELLSLPVGIFRAYVEMLPRLTAEESMLAAQRVAMGSGTIDESASKRIRRAWEELSNPRPRDSKGSKGQRFDRSAMARAGIKVVKVKSNES